jgi:hypothetical protein
MWDKIKKYAWIIGAVIVALAVAFAFCKPAREIKTTTTSKESQATYSKLKSLAAQVSVLTTQKTEIEKKLAQASETARNVNRYREWYPNGILKSETLIDLSKYFKKIDSVENSTTTLTTALLARIAELEQEIETLHSKESQTTKTDTRYAHTFGLGVAVNPLNLSEFGLSGAIRVGQDLEVSAIVTQKDTFKELKALINAMFFVF